MQGHTHLVIGVTAALAVLRPDTLPMLVLGTGAAAVGAVIPDIDVGTSESHRDADKVIALSVLAAAGVAVCEGIFHLGIADRIRADTNLARILLALAAFIGICFYGKGTAHRTFMHSLLALCLLTACMGVFLPVTVPYFTVAAVSHLSSDLLNRRGEELLWPLKKGFCLRLCASDGRVNRLLFRSCGGTSVLLFVLLAAHCILK